MKTWNLNIALRYGKIEIGRNLVRIFMKMQRNWKVERMIVKHSFLRSSRRKLRSLQHYWNSKINTWKNELQIQRAFR